MKAIQISSLLALTFITAQLFGQTGQTLAINLRKANPCYEIVNGDKKVQVKNELGQKATVIFGGVSMEVPTDGLTVEYSINSTDEINFLTNNASMRFALLPGPYNMSYKTTSTVDVNIGPCQAPPPPSPPNEANSYKFIPDPVQEAQYKKEVGKRPNGCKGVYARVGKGSEMIYNYQDNCLCFFKDGKSKSKLRPKVDGTLHIGVISYNPYRDSIVIEKRFEQRNMDFEAKFGALFGDLSKSSEEKVEEKDKSNTKPTDPSAQSIKDNIKSFKDEMKIFSEEWRNRSDLSLALLEKYLLHIKSKIRENFSIPNANGTSIRNAVTKLINNDNTASKEQKASALKDLEEALKYYEQIQEYRVIGFMPIPIISADITEITIKKFKSGASTPLETQPYPFYNRGGFKIDYSAGLFLHGLVDHRFTTTPVTVKDTTFTTDNPPVIDTILNVTKGRIIRENSDKFTISAGIMSHAYSRWGKRFNIGLSLGLLAEKKQEDVRMKYLGGLSFLLGSEQRLVISGGAITGKVTRLGEGLQEGMIIDPPPAGEPINIQVRDVFDWSWFIGLTYNFGSLPKKAK